MREIEEESRRWKRMLRKSLAVRKRLEEKIKGLKLSLIVAGVGNLKSDSE